MLISRLRLDLRFLLGAFLAVAVTFLAASVLSQLAMARIDDASDEIAFSSAPAIQRLAGVRAAVRHAEYLLSAAVTIGGPDARAAVAPAMAELAAEASAFMGLSVQRARPESRRELGEAIAAFQTAVLRALERLDRAQGEEARAALVEVMAAAERVSDVAAGAMNVSAEHGRVLALRIKAIRRNAKLIAWGTTASCLLFTLLVALLVRRQLQRYGALVEERAALQEERSRELESFAGRAAHDILNPVSATQMSLDLAARLQPEDPRVHELVERARRTLLRVRTIVDGLLRFARAGAAAEPGASAAVRAVIEDVVVGLRPAAEEAGLDLQAQELCDCRVRCSEGVLTSVVSNLVQNALKYSSGSGERPRVAVRAQRRAGRVRVEIEDGGPGIPASSLQGIFRPFVRGPTLGKEGLGLGLATVKRLCESHGGEVGVRSVVGSGSVFWFELPVADGPATQVPPVSGS